MDGKQNKFKYTPDAQKLYIQNLYKNLLGIKVQKDQCRCYGHEKYISLN